jgi:hypothetical protein
VALSEISLLSFSSSMAVQTCRRALQPVGCFLLVLLWVAPGAIVSDAFAQAIDPAVRTAAAAGPVRVIVELRLAPPFRPEGELSSPAAVEAQRRAIAQAQDDLLASLAGTSFSVGRKYDGLPLIALEIGADALDRLEAAGALVTRVSSDSPRFRQP